MKGFLHKTPTGIRCELVTGFGASTILTGTPAVVNGVNGYLCETVDDEASWIDPPPAPKPASVEAKPVKPPKPGASRFLGDICPDCMVAHPEPACGHDAGKPCPGCGRPFGLLTAHMAGSVCWQCERARGGET